MDFIIGGAFQGKTDYALQKYKLQSSDILPCEGLCLPSSIGISHVERFAAVCVAAGLVPLDEWKKQAPKAAIVLCDDIFCGVVPMEAQTRLWREETGRLASYLAKTASTVTKIFYGLPLELKK